MTDLDYMQVQPPPPPLAGRGGSREVTLTRLARNVSVLFGVDVPQNAVGTTWVCDFNSVAVKEIARGAATSRGQHRYTVPPGNTWLCERVVVKGPETAAVGSPEAGIVGVEVGPIVEIPPASMSRFGPDTKSAAILTASNVLGTPLVELVGQVMGMFNMTESAEKVSDITRVLAWASLMLEAYRAQPALFVAAVQARQVQRACTLGWKPMIDRSVFVKHRTLAEAEYQPSDPSTYGQQNSVNTPTRWNLLDDTMHQIVQPQLLGGAEETDASNSYQMDLLIERFIRYIGQSAHRGLAWVVDDGQGRHHVDAQIRPIALLGAFIESTMAMSKVTTETGKVTFDPTDVDHWELGGLVPRVPSLPELKSLSGRVQIAVLHTLSMVLRSFLSIPNLDDTFRDSLLDRLARIVDLADQALGSDSTAGIYIRNQWALTTVARHPENRAGATVQIDTLLALREQTRHGRFNIGRWVETAVNNSPGLNQYRRRLAESDQPADHETAARVVDILDDISAEVMDRLEINLTRELNRTTWSRHLVHASSLLHNYLGYQLTHPDPSTVAYATQWGEALVLPIREEIWRQRGSGSTLRLTLQILLRGIDRALADPGLDAAQRSALRARCHRFLDHAYRLPEMKRLSDTHHSNGESDIHLLISVLAGELALAGVTSTDPATSTSPLRQRRSTDLRWLHQVIGDQVGIGTPEPRLYTSITTSEITDYLNRAQLHINQENQQNQEAV